MGNRNKLLRKLEAIRDSPNVAPFVNARNVVVSRHLRGQNRLVQKFETMRARRNEAPFTTAPRVTIGRHTYGSPVIPQFAGSAVTVEIGSFCSIAANVMLVAGGGHNPAWVSTW